MLKLEEVKHQHTSLQDMLEESQNTANEAAAFSAMNHEHTMNRLTQRLNELTDQNQKLTEEKVNLQLTLKDMKQRELDTFKANDAQIALLENRAKEAHFNYERILSNLTEKLTSKLIDGWNEREDFSMLKE